MQAWRDQASHRWIRMVSSCSSCESHQTQQFQQQRKLFVQCYTAYPAGWFKPSSVIFAWLEFARFDFEPRFCFGIPSTPAKSRQNFERDRQLYLPRLSCSCSVLSFCAPAATSYTFVTHRPAQVVHSLHPEAHSRRFVPCTLCSQAADSVLLSQIKVTIS